MPETFERGSRFSRPAVRSILGVGIATLDIVNEVEVYPAEDAEMRASAQRRVRGGNVANSLGVLAQFGHHCRWLGTLADDDTGRWIREDLARQGIDAAHAVVHAGGATPTSYIALSRASGSRTIVHYRDLPELDADGFDRVPLEGLDWIHFEGRNPLETRRMIDRVRRIAPGLSVSLELEKPRDGIETLLEGPDVILAGRVFAEARGFEVPESFLSDLMSHTSAQLCVLAWGAAGAFFLVRGAEVEHVPAVPPPRVLDTLAAGDTFNAAVIDALARSLTPRESVERAVGLAGFKCGRIGLEGLIDEARNAGLMFQPHSDP
ncbi:PfkB family carbohydrate kinase [Imhoffiella purpurea]|uniref:Ketohexokinase n=1 Tax=Imhoffiella purpurea TaxID=1249627 RepID=W9VFX1_9GAMM|nr:PfkB family carbohydrate kinase [Imhoffiella purpurea]EXJ15891.1 Ketohexokinase [Imhoffiella purpurea]